MADGFHILAEETGQGYRITVPEYPEIVACCRDAADIIPAALETKRKIM